MTSKNLLTFLRYNFFLVLTLVGYINMLDIWLKYELDNGFKIFDKLFPNVRISGLCEKFLISALLKKLKLIFIFIK